MEQEAPIIDIHTVVSKLSYIKISEPGAGMSYLIERNLEELVSLILGEINEFTNTNAVKKAGLIKLGNLIAICGDKIEPYTENILVLLYRNLFQYDEPEFIEIVIAYRRSNNLDETDSLLSWVCCPLVAGHIKSELQKNAIKTIENILIVLDSAIEFQGMEGLIKGIDYIVEILSLLEDIYLDNIGPCTASLSILNKVVKRIGKDALSRCSSAVFSPYLAIQSTIAREQGPEVLGEVTEELAKCCGYPDAAAMYSEEVKEILEQMYLKKGYAEWDKYSKDRFKFAVIVRFCNRGIHKYMEIILDIISKCTENPKDPILKFDMLELLDYVISATDTQPYIKENASSLIRKVICQVLVWRAGKPNIKIRKAGIICLSKLIKFGLISSSDAYDNYKDLFSAIKSCMDDDWAPDLRYFSTQLMQELIELIKDELSDFELSTLYPVLLERLDDAQDKIRIQVTQTLRSFLLCKNLRMSSSTLEYVIKTCFIHLDDRNEDIQKSIFEFLKFAISIDRDIVEKEAIDALKKQKFPRFTEELLKIIEGLKTK